MRLNASFAADITRAAEILRAGGLVAFPTETVYGLGANALSAEAVEQIFAAKQRPHWDPLIVHIAEREQLQQIAVASSEAERLMDAFWPGPLTLLLPKTSAIPYSVTAGRSLVGVRIPAHPVAQALLRETGVPIAAPSANTFGHTSPTTAEHVLADLDGRIDAVLDGGPTAVGLESTVCETTGAGAIVYRPGGVTVQMLESVLAQGKITLYHPEPESPPASLPSPGVGIRHYAPRARLQLIEVLQSSASDCLLEPARRALEQGARLGVMLPDDWLTDSRAVLYLWARWSDPATLAQRLFAGLRALDDAGVDLILCPVPTGPGIAEAIRDRLEKAAKQT
jgi:L-threonylcarbamoyladenylate synthase